MLLIYIALGGAAGALARFGLAGWVHSWAGETFPWGTLMVNLVGSLLLGLVFRFLEGIAATAELRGLLTIGFLGAFTTFSTFSFETVSILQDGEWGRAAAYAIGSVFLGLVGVFAGFYLAAALLRHGG